MRLFSVMIGIAAATGWALGQALPATPPAPKPRFDVASIRQHVVGSAAARAVQDGEHYSAASTLLYFIRRAYGLEDYQIAGPKAVLDSSWAIRANAAPGTTPEETNLMLQSLLEERFHLTFHHEMKEFKAYNLVIAKGGLKLKESLPTDACAMGMTPVGGKCGALPESFGIAKSKGGGFSGMTTSPAAGLTAGTNAPMSSLVRVLRTTTGEIVIDKTGLSGGYDLRIQYSAVDAKGRPFDAESPLPSIFDALPAQLGMRLEPARAVVEVMVIERVDAAPTEN
jgi:uncharacterized protein (TIGR03435 family)